MIKHSHSVHTFVISVAVVSLGSSQLQIGQSYFCNSASTASGQELCTFNGLSRGDCTPSTYSSCDMTTALSVPLVPGIAEPDCLSAHYTNSRSGVPGVNVPLQAEALKQYSTSSVLGVN